MPRLKRAHHDNGKRPYSFQKAQKQCPHRESNSGCGNKIPRAANYTMGTDSAH